MIWKPGIFPLGLLLLVIIAGVVRVIGISWGLPQEFHPDEPLVVPRAIWAITLGDWNPHYFLVPSLQTELTSIAYGVLYIGGWIAGQFSNPGDFGEWAAWNYGSLYLIGRSISVIFGLLTVLGTVLLTREVLCQSEIKGVGSHFVDLASLLSGLIVAVSPLITASSRLITPDIPMLAFFVWTIWALMYSVNHSSKKHVVLGGFLCGLAISSKYSAAILVVPLLVSLFLTRTGESGGKKRMPILKALGALLGGFLLGTPYALLDFGTFYSHLMIQYSAQHEGHIGMEQAGLTLSHWIRDLLTIEGYGIAILALPGVIVLWNKQRKAWWVIVPLLLLYLTELSRWQVYAERYLLPALPLLALLTSLTWLFITHNIKVLATRYVVAIAIAALVLIPPAIVNVQQTSKLLLPDTRTLALQWVEENIPAGSRILLEIGGPQPADSNQEFHREPAYDIIILPPSFSESSQARDPSLTLVLSDPDYVITSSNYRSRYEDRYTREKYPKIARAWGTYYSLLEEYATVAYQVEPGSNPDSGEQIGPEITIYCRESNNMLE